MLDVSIIIPVYCTTDKSLEWLDECLASAMSQDCEVVLYNDSSTQDISPVISRYSIPISNGIHNMGASFARNRAIEMATKSLIFPLDCDDRLAPGAIARLLQEWDGETPVYPDVAKFGDETEPHYVLLDFHCDHLFNYVGFTSVNVLHAKQQWRDVGGYDESLDFYEDGEYNARLLGKYCGKHLSLPLVAYRQHDAQRTRTHSKVAHDYANRLLERIRRYDMACKACGGQRRTASNLAGSNKMNNMTSRSTASVPIPVPKSAEVVNMPLELDGKILAIYTGGKGMAKHFYKGLRTKFPYRVSNGDMVYANPPDVGEPGTNWSFLIRYVPPTPPPPSPAPTQPAPVLIQPQEAPKRPAVVEVKTEPATEAMTNQAIELPDLSTMNVKAILSMPPFSPEAAAELVKQEQAGLNRRKVLEWLKGQLG